VSGFGSLKRNPSSPPKKKT